MYDGYNRNNNICDYIQDCRVVAAKAKQTTLVRIARKRDAAKSNHRGRELKRDPAL